MSELPAQKQQQSKNPGEVIEVDGGWMGWVDGLQSYLCGKGDRNVQRLKSWGRWLK